MNNNSSNNNLSGKHHFSIVLSFAVAMFAIISLIAVGFNQISFAAPNDGESVETFKLGAKYRKSINGENKVVEVTSYSNQNDNNDFGFNVSIMYVADASYDPSALSPDINTIEPVFCYGRRSVAAGDALDYTNNEEILDGRIAYILSKSGVFNENSSIIPKGTGGEYYRYLEIYATQVAIWMINNDPSITDNNGDIAGANSYALSINQNNPAVNIYTGNLFSYIQDVVNKANVESKNVISGKKFEINVDENYSDVEGTNYYQTSLIQVVPTPSDDFISYDLSFNGVEGMFAVDENGAELSKLNGLLASDKVYIRIPKDKVSEGVNTINITATGRFKNSPVAYKYVADYNHQAIVRLEKGDRDLSDVKSLTITASPDTGASTSQTIYFIGLVVLLCGVGIIYANSKAIKNV